MSLEHLYYALLLPSGNDAALVLADFFGGVIQKYASKEPQKSSAFADNPSIRFFLSEMNNLARKLGMPNTVFDSPHGLSNPNNLSTAADMAVLAFHCMKNDLFCQIVSTPFFEVGGYEWQNTNRLLGFDFDQEDTVELFKGTLGCKTGVT